MSGCRYAGLKVDDKLLEALNTVDAGKRKEGLLLTDVPVRMQERPFEDYRIVTIKCEGEL